MSNITNKQVLETLTDIMTDSTIKHDRKAQIKELARYIAFLEKQDDSDRKCTVE